MNILKYLLPCIALLFFSTTVVYADDHNNKKYYDKDGKKYLKKMWDKKGKKTWDKKGKLKQGHMFGPPPMMGDRMGHGGPFAMIEAQGRLFLYNKKTGDVWVCNAFQKTCEQIVVENKDTD